MTMVHPFPPPLPLPPRSPLPSRENTIDKVRTESREFAEQGGGGAAYLAIAFTIPRIRAHVNRGTVRDGKRSGPRKSSSPAILSFTV